MFRYGKHVDILYANRSRYTDTRSRTGLTEITNKSLHRSRNDFIRRSSRDSTVTLYILTVTSNMSSYSV